MGHLEKINFFGNHDLSCAGDGGCFRPHVELHTHPISKMGALQVSMPNARGMARMPRKVPSVRVPGGKSQMPSAWHHL